MNKPKIQEQFLETAIDVCGHLVHSREIVSIEEKRNRYQILKEIVEVLIKESEEFLKEIKNEE